MTRTQPTATINKEEEITLGADIFVVGFEITARIDAGSKDSRDTPGEPASVDEWVDLKIQYVECPSGNWDGGMRLLEEYIQGLAEMNGMGWVDEYDRWEDYDDDDYDRERE